MVYFTCQGGDIQIRLVKTFTTGKDVLYFDEYCPVEDRKTYGSVRKRYIVAEEASCGVEVTLKKGFCHADYTGGLYLILKDMDSGKEFYNQRLFEQEFRNRSPIQIEQRCTITSIKSVLMNGVLRSNVKLGFQKMKLGRRHCMLWHEDTHQ